MKNYLKLIGIIALAAVIGFSAISCKDAEPENISITITDIPGSTYAGWKAVVGLATDSVSVAVGLPLNVTASTSSLTFDMLESGSKSFNKAGTYYLVFWFEKNGEEDVDFYKAAQSIKEGSNSISFNSLSSL